MIHYIKISISIYVILNILIPVYYENFTAWADSLLPKNFSIIDEFQPGIGNSVGQFRQVEGDVIVIHENEDHAYQVQQNLPLYKGDTVIVQENGHAALEMEDKSLISMSSHTTIVINQSIYIPEAKRRFAFITMTLGKARFWVKKLSNLRHSNFKIKTKTAIVGVRGSDFVIESAENFTIISTMKNTRLEVVSLFSRCKKTDNMMECGVEQYLVNDFEQIVVEKYDRILESRPLSPEEKDQIEDAFPPVPDTGPPIDIPPVILAESPDITIPHGREQLNREFMLNKMQQVIEDTNRELPDYPAVPE